MKYIKKITLENFQSHKYSVIELDERMNVIVGPSDSGKSAIIRGLKWVLFNEPSGNYFIREGENECSVTVEFSDSTILKRLRTKSKNSYVLYNNNGEKMKFEGFGSIIPNEIIEEIGIKKIYLDSTESSFINLGEQLEGAFLLSEKTSTRASAIGRLVGVNIVDVALRDVLKDIRGLNVSTRTLEDNNIALKTEIEGYEFLNDLKKRYTKAKDLENDINNSLELLNKLSVYKSKIAETKKESLELKNILKELDGIEKIDESLLAIESRIIKYKYINNYAKTLQKLKEDILSNSNIIQDLKGLDLANGRIASLEKNNLQYGKLASIFSRLDMIKNDIINTESLYTGLKGLDKVVENFHKITNSVEKYIKLKTISTDYSNVFKNIATGKDYIEKFSELEKVEGIFKNLDKRLKILTRYSDLLGLSINYLNEIKREETSLMNINKTISEELIKYESLLKKVELCPFCLSEIDEMKINHIINHYIGG
ncbi:hypothetical protein E9840_00660 [Tissierella creatinini]|nr:hypothetical protein E9840_00660 [Tissierella creatinini]TJX69136.1 hypothetical protein E8P77_00460 [Soehngenia saccharolytica]